MRGANFFSLAVLFIFSCGEYAEIPYEHRIGGSPNEPNVPAQLIWNLAMKKAVATGGGWYKFSDKVNTGKSDSDFDCGTTTCNWTETKSGVVNISYSPYQLNATRYDAYAGVGFNWLSSGAAAPEIINPHTGLCVEYSLGGSGEFHIIIMPNPEKLFGYDNFKISLPKRSNVGKQFFSFNDFAQEGWDGSIKGTLDQVKNVSIGIHFQGTMQNVASNYTGSATLTLKSVAFDSCNY